MTYELAKQLKEAGFPQKRYGDGGIFLSKDHSYCNCDICECEGQAGGYADESPDEEGHYYAPTLSELTEACGGKYRDMFIWQYENKWYALSLDSSDNCGEWSNSHLDISIRSGECSGSTPEIAVAMLYLALNKK